MTHSDLKSNSATDVTNLLERRQRLLGPAYRLLYEEPLHPVRGEGIWLYDADGRKYLDAYNNVPSVGHCHPRVIEALARQSALLNTHTRYLHELILDYAEDLLSSFPSELGNVMFTCTGSEANDLALRVARTCTGNTGFIVTNFAYHGVTAAIAEMSPSLGPAVQLGSHVRTVPAPDTYRANPATAAHDFETSARLAIEDMKAAGIKPAALMIDTIFASDGIYPGEAGLIAGAVSAVREAGGLYIADEVQVGLGRVGTHMWGFERHHVTPDMVTLGKPIGAGHPLAALVARPELLQDFGRRSRYFNTFGGNPVSAAVGLAVLQIVRDEKLKENALHVGAHLRQSLENLKSKHELVGDVRSLGLYAGVEVVADPRSRAPSPEFAACVVNHLRSSGVLVGICGAHSNVLKIRPPLPFSKSDVDLLTSHLDSALEHCRA